MEEQTIKTISAPRITLKKSGMKRMELGWEISSSSSDDEAELKLIMEMITKIHGDMEKAFLKVKIKQEDKE